ncbi:MAG: hypothetical protein HYT82_02355 [Candidatus Harrisonbacteria bacterium]|nr:hypothetical protein [Candidatus Harrisonbacteria bacterium]
MKKLLILLVLAVVAVGVWYLLQGGTPVEAPAPAPVTEALPEASPTADLDAELELIDIGDVDADFQEVDADLNQL